MPRFRFNFLVLLSALVHLLGISILSTLTTLKTNSRQTPILISQVVTPRLSPQTPTTNHPSHAQRGSRKREKKPILTQPIRLGAKETLPSPLPPGNGQTRQFSMLGGADSKCLDQFHHQVESALEYPLALRRRRLQGEVTLKMEINRNGQIESLKVLQTSGYTELDDLALKAITRAGPFVCSHERPHEGKNEKEKQTGRLTISLPVHFKLN